MTFCIRVFTDTLVLFYKSFEENFYRYTKIGLIKDAGGLKETLGSSDAKVKFEIIKQGSIDEKARVCQI